MQSKVALGIYPENTNSVSVDDQSINSSLNDGFILESLH
jgi:hypothetical protein